MGESVSMARVDCLQRIITYNYSRDPERLRLKYAAMKADAFAFLRGTCHLFYSMKIGRTQAP